MLFALIMPATDSPVKVHQFKKLDAALTACDFYNYKAGSRHYILNEEGKEYYEDFWID
ncbi:hypothetical protein [Bathymodiolus platifrons methanotrophic gill symbiont]|uniref:hypothetical protein n=2 Tax=Bathymodiolus platifrons methanotrophic gill symbiont TaxID=113268 RepID=UPI00142D8B1A|nr:hypothetical protein [Bathymodiolus platifrons methanotrophic gill symbiont]